MREEKILEFLKENNIQYLKLGNVSFSKSENLLCLTFLYNEEFALKLEEEKDKIKMLVKQFIDITEIKIKIKFIKAFLDENRLKILIKDYLNEHHKMALIALKNVDIKFYDNTFDIKLYLSLSTEEANKIENELLFYLNNKYFYNFEIESKIVSDNSDVLNEHKHEILDSLIDPVIIKKMKVNKVENIIGTIEELTCYPYEYYKAPEENIYLCGHLESIEEIEYTKKETDIKAVRFSLKIKCLDDVFGATIFPTKKNLEIIKSIESGIDVIMQGGLELFQNKLNFRIKNLAKCVILDYERPVTQINKIFDKYNYVLPTKYQEVEQINLFEEKIQKDYLLNNEFVVFDLETTGLDYNTEKITEIGAVKIKNGIITETFSTFINPQKQIDEEITKITGITDEMVKDAPLFEKVLPDFFKFCQNCILVGQNVSFDFGFIDFYSRQINYIFDHEKEDTLNIAKKHIFLKNYKLKTIADSLNVPLINAHRAINDAICTAKVFIKLVEKYY